MTKYDDLIINKQVRSGMPKEINTVININKLWCNYFCVCQQFLSVCWTFPKCQYTSWSFATLSQQGEKFDCNTYSFISHPAHNVHRSSLLPPSQFVFLVAYQFDVFPPRCFCHLTFFPPACFRHYCLVFHHIPTKTTAWRSLESIS